MGKLANFRDVIKELRRSDRKEKTVNVCPKCASPKIFLSTGSDIYPRMYGITPRQYVCSNCGYKGPIILEKIKENEKTTD